MSYSIENFKDGLQTAIDFTNIVVANGYGNVNGNYQAFWFEKIIDNESSFRLEVTTQISGYVRADLRYSKTITGTTNSIKINLFLSSTLLDLDARIKLCEDFCLKLHK